MSAKITLAPEVVTVSPSGEVELAHRGREPDQVVAVPLVEVRAPGGSRSGSRSRPSFSVNLSRRLVGRSLGRDRAGGRRAAAARAARRAPCRRASSSAGSSSSVRMSSSTASFARADRRARTSRIDSIEPIVCCARGLPSSSACSASTISGTCSSRSAAMNVRPAIAAAEVLVGDRHPVARDDRRRGPRSAAS